MSVRIIIGIVLTVFGIAAAVFPNAFAFLTGPEVPNNVHETVERRVRGGMVLGVGLMFFAVSSFRPWSTSIPTIIFYFMTGALAARILGMLVDGTAPRQWMLTGVEAVVMALIAFWFWRSTGQS